MIYSKLKVGNNHTDIKDKRVIQLLLTTLKSKQSVYRYKRINTWYGLLLWHSFRRTQVVAACTYAARASTSS